MPWLYQTNNAGKAEAAARLQDLEDVMICSDWVQSGQLNGQKTFSFRAVTALPRDSHNSKPKSKQVPVALDPGKPWPLGCQARRCDR